MDNWTEAYEMFFEQLVPEKGHAESVQGEMVRIIGKVSREILDNGSINWDTDYEKMVNALDGYLAMFGDDAVVSKGRELAKGINPDSSKDQLYALTQAITMVVQNNPELISLGEVEYDR